MNLLKTKNFRYLLKIKLPEYILKAVEVDKSLQIRYRVMDLISVWEPNHNKNYRSYECLRKQTDMELTITATETCLC